MKSIKIFAYGSLMYKDSLLSTAPSARNIKPVKLFGFVRVFNFPSHSRLSELDQTPCAVLNIDKSDLDHELNGIVFEVSHLDFEDILEREKGYELVRIEVEDFYNSNSKFFAFMFRAKHFDAHNFQHNSKKQYEYLNWCLNAAKEHGEDFFNNFIESTYLGDLTLKKHFEEDNLNKNLLDF